MFTQDIPRSGNPVGGSTKSIIKRVGATIGICALTAGFALAAPAAADATGMPTSYSEGRFLSGTLLGVDLQSIAELAPAFASNDGSQTMQRSSNPLSLMFFDSIGVNGPSGVQLDELLDAGTLHQFAQAVNDGSSMASSGAIGRDGGIGVAGAAGDIDLDLDSLLSSRYASILTDLRLSLDAVAAQASASMRTATGDYTLAGATLTFTSPAIAQLSPKVNLALGPVDDALVSLDGDHGVLGNALHGVVDPVLGAIGSSANVTAVVTNDVHAAVQPLLTGAYGDGAVSFNLQTGDVSVNLAQLLGGRINDLSPGTELLSGPVVNQILKGITDTVSALTDQILDRVRLALNSAQVTVRAHLDLATPQGSQHAQVCREIQVPIIGNILSPIAGYTTNTVCDVVTTVLPDLRSTVNVNVQGTVQQILAGTATTSEASVSLLGGTVNAKIDANEILDSLAAGLTDSLFDSDGAVAKVAERLDSGLVNPAVNGLLGTASVSTVLTSVVSVKVNVQELSRGPNGDHDNMFTQTAVRVTMLKDAGSPGLATLNLAQASVGPNVTRVADSCLENCGTSENPDPTCATNCATTEGPGGSITAATGSLAFTGAGIAALIALILVLLTIGVLLAREGHRRNQANAIATH